MSKAKEEQAKKDSGWTNMKTADAATVMMMPSWWQASFLPSGSGFFLSTIDHPLP